MYLNLGLQYKTSPQNVQIAQTEAMTDAILTMPNLTARNRSILTAIKNGGDAGSLCVFYVFSFLI